MLNKLIASLLIVYSFGSFALDDCQEIIDDHTRLVCFDEMLSKQKMMLFSAESRLISEDEMERKFDFGRMNFSQISDYFAKLEQFRVVPHYPTYILPASYNNKPNDEVYEQLRPGVGINKMEVKFQISGRAKLWNDLYKDNWDFWFGYTQIAWWQLYNSDDSSPFRDTNYSPEVFVSYSSDVDIWGFTLQQSDIGFIHQSNGQSDIFSRSWNRIYVNLQFTRDNFLISLQPWYRLPEDADDDDNPDIDKYMGYGNYQLSYKNKSNVYSILLRNNLRSDGNKGAVELSWESPLYKSLKFYVQYFNGYGESLLDYNHSSNRLSLGVLIYDWI